MIIKISGLKNGKHTYVFEGKTEKLEIEDPVNGEFKADVVLNKIDNQIILDVSTNTKANFICDRCNEEFQQEIGNSYKMVYVLESVENDKDELDITYLAHETDKIDLSDDVRDYIILSIPMKKLCKEDCKGLCIKCGKNLNEGPCECKEDEIDDRWKSLLDLKNKLNTN